MADVVRERLVVEAEGVRKDIHTVQYVYDFLEDLSAVAGMRILTPPQVVRVPVLNSVIPTDNDCGISASVIWLESGAQVHTWPEAGLFTLDMFSCRHFDEKEVIAFVVEKTAARTVKAYKPVACYACHIPTEEKL